MKILLLLLLALPLEAIETNSVTNSTFVDVFVSGSEGYPCYRLPSALKLPSGLLLLFAEGRFGGDTGSRTDIVYKTSQDEGRSWSPLQVLYTEWQPPGHSWHTFTKNATFNSTRTFWGRDGYLDYRTGAPVGLNKPFNLTLADAEAMCANHTDCFGFEFLAQVRHPLTVIQNIYFKLACRFTADRGNIVTLHNPAPVAVDGKALVVFGRNFGGMLSMRALDDAATKWGSVEQVVDSSVVPIAGSTPGPPGGIVFPVQRSGGTVNRIAIAYDAHVGGAALLSDDGGRSWWTSKLASPHGGEAQIALAPNGSLLLNSRGPTQGVRWQSVSDDFGETWSAPRVLDFGFGSSCEGSIMRVPNTSSLVFSHAGRINNRYNRWNLTVWRSVDSGATWAAAIQLEKLNATELPKLHTAYSTLLALSAAPSQGSAGGSGGLKSVDATMGIAYERGPMPGSHITPSKCGEYATIRWKTFELEDA